MSGLSHGCRVLGWVLLLFLIPLAAILGSVSSGIAMGAALLFAFFVVRPGAWEELRREPATLIFLGAFVVLAFVFAITADEPRDGIYALNFIALPLAAAVFLVARPVEDARQAIMTIAILGLAGTLVGLLNVVNEIVLLYSPRMPARFMGPNTLSRLVLIFAFMGVAGMFVTTSRFRYLFLIGPIAAAVVTHFTGTRGMVPAIPILSVLAAVMLYLTTREKLAPILLALIGVVMTGALLLFSARLATLIGTIPDDPGGAGYAAASVNQRWEMLVGAYQLFLQSPLIGHGWANFAPKAYPIIGNLVWGGPSDPFFQFHADAANFAVSGGVVGLACLAALLLAPLVGVLASPRDGLFRLRLYCCLLLSAWAAGSGLTDMTLGYDLPTVIYAFLTAIVLGAFRERAPAPLAADQGMRIAA